MWPPNCIERARSFRLGDWRRPKTMARHYSQDPALSAFSASFDAVGALERAMWRFFVNQAVI